MALPKILVLTVPTAQPETHAVSLILNVAQEGVQEQWPLTILVRAKASPQHLSTAGCARCDPALPRRRPRAEPAGQPHYCAGRSLGGGWEVCKQAPSR